MRFLDLVVLLSFAWVSLVGAQSAISSYSSLSYGSMSSYSSLSGYSMSSYSSLSYGSMNSYSSLSYGSMSSYSSLSGYGSYSSAMSTDMPTESPTSQPSTSQPSTIPTQMPTCPTSQPTGQPTGQPTSQPTGMPTGQPSSVPTSAPTETTKVIIDVKQTLNGLNATQFNSNPNNLQAFTFATATSIGVGEDQIYDVMASDKTARRRMLTEIYTQRLRRRLTSTNSILVDYKVVYEVGPLVTEDEALNEVAVALEASTSENCTSNCFNDNLETGTTTYGADAVLLNVTTEQVTAAGLTVVPQPGSGGGDDDDYVIFGLNENEVMMAIIGLAIIMGIPLIYAILRPSKAKACCLNVYYLVCFCCVTRKKDWSEDMAEHFETPGPMHGRGDSSEMDGSRGTSGVSKGTGGRNMAGNPMTWKNNPDNVAGDRKSKKKKNKDKLRGKGRGEKASSAFHFDDEL